MGIGSNAAASPFELTPSIAVREEYNDNIEFSHSNPVEDWITRVSPQLEWAYRSQRSEARLNGRLDAFSHANNAGYNRQGYRADGLLRHGLTERLDLALDARLTADQDIGDLDPETGIVTGNADRTDWNASTTVRYRLSEISNLSIKYAQGAEDYDTDRYSDHVRYDLSGTYTRDIGDLWKATVAQVNAGFARYDYQTSQTETYYLSAGASKVLTETLSLTAVFGGRYNRLEYPGIRLVPITLLDFIIGYTSEAFEARTDQWSYIGQLIVDHRRETGSDRFAVVRDIRAASGRYGTTENTRFSLDLSHRITDTLTVVVTAAYYTNTAENREAAGRIDEQTLEFSPSLRYRWKDDWTVEAGYRFTEEKDDMAATRTDRNQIHVLVSYRHPLLE